MSDARQVALALLARMNEVAHPGRPLPDGLALFGIGHAEVTRSLVALEQRTRHSAWNIHPQPSFDPEDGAYELDRRSRERGLDLRMITPPRTLRFNPLLTSLSPNLLLGPAMFRLLLLDRTIALLDGPPMPDGETTFWIVTGGSLLEDSIALWDATLRESRRAVPEGSPPPLDRRQLEVARGVCLGRTDAAIARQLGISQRTVARDVAAILEVTGARSRGEAILNMLGRGRQSRT
ncbi:regulatory LuxR family protein [Knoellia remsis]|uniref:Regulatory LuxR family protein n=1 Tax=Knoellia remsis TaxID=407159 RepID=A0A2T0UGF8_9MICO|nr:helix-turn-helix transcriptional regulator [Knoellia remsis]PRY57031.1 regulatory LuxR family protein [Knoellia remsis]